MAARASDHLPALDGMRGTAILLVIVHHCLHGHAPGTLGERLIDGVAGICFCGVDAFFALSGFLITSILLSSRDSPTYFRSFYARRAFRIFPVYYAFLAGLFIAWPLLHPRGEEWFHTLQANQVWYWTYTTNILVALRGSWSALPFDTLHLWSLAVEEQFYLVWPLVVLLVKPGRLLPLCFALLATSTLLRVGVCLHGADEPARLAMYVLTPTRLDALMAGAIIALVRRSPGGLGPQLRPIRIAMTVALVALAPLTIHGPFRLPTSLPMELVGFPAFAVLFGGLVAHLVTGDGHAATRIPVRVFSHPWLRYFGRYSYAIYIVHNPIIFLLQETRLTPEGMASAYGLRATGLVAFILVVTALSTLVARVSWVLIEQPFLRLKDRFPVRAPA